MELLWQALVQGLIFGSIYGVGAVGFALVYNTTRIFHVVYGALANLGLLVAMAMGAGSHPWRLFATVPLGMVAAALVGVAIYVLVYRTMAHRGATPINIFVASLGLNLLISAVLQIVYGPTTLYFDYPSLFRTHQLAGLDLSDLDLICIVVGLVVAGTALVLIRRTFWGRQVRAVSSSSEVAALVGVRSTLVLVTVFAASSAIAMLCGLLYGMQTSVAAPVDPTLTLLAAISVLLAGRGSYFGAYSAGMCLGVVEGIVAAELPGQWSVAVVFGIFVIVTLARPRGLFAGRVT
jgi:branched-chain amino acid transport system permease protein